MSDADWPDLGPLPTMEQVDTEPLQVTRLRDQLRDVTDERNAALSECSRLRERIAVLEAERRDPNGDRLEALARRFQGVDISYRQGWSGWSARNYAAKNRLQMSDYRVAGGGATAAEAIDALLDAIDAVDRSKPA